MKKPLILLSNDDGISAAGLRALAAAVGDLGEIMVAAPDRERSAASHSMSLNQPLRVDEVEPGWFAIDGTPVDCVYLGVLHLAPRRPDLCVSGFNHGYNLGSDVFYSGTVAAAVEATLRGVPSIAVSVAPHRPSDFSHAGRLVHALAAQVLARRGSAEPAAGIPEGALLNVNCPAGPFSEYRVTHLGKRVYRDQVEVRADLRGRSYYWIGGPEDDVVDLPGSDLTAVRSGMASITPLGLDLTHPGLARDLENWDVRNFVKNAVAIERASGA